MVKKISEKEFDEVKENGVLVVDFSADWCGPCKMLAPVLEEISEEMTEVAFYNIDIGENPNLAQKFEIASIPTLVVMEDGEKKDMLVGFKPKDNVVAFINAQI